IVLFDSAELFLCNYFFELCKTFHRRESNLCSIDLESMKTSATLLILLVFFITACNNSVKKKEKEQLARRPDTIVQTAIGNLQLPPPYATKSVTVRST